MQELEKLVQTRGAQAQHMQEHLVSLEAKNLSLQAQLKVPSRPLTQVAQLEVSVPVVARISGSGDSGGNVVVVVVAVGVDSSGIPESACSLSTSL